MESGAGFVLDGGEGEVAPGPPHPAAPGALPGTAPGTARRGRGDPEEVGDGAETHHCSYR